MGTHWHLRSESSFETSIEAKVRRFFKSQLTFLLFGIVFWLPVAVLIFIISILLMNAEDFGRKFLLLVLPQSLVYPGLGIALAVIIIYLTGIILRVTRIRKFFSKIPLLGLFFGSGEIITVDRLLNLKPCLFLFSPTCPSYGWILSEEKVKVDADKALFNMINIYYPNVPTLVTGQVFPVRKENVVRLGNPSKEIIDLLLYAFRSPQDLRYLPWEGETLEDFRKRAQCFGLDISGEL
jgi:uncharacterized membrane protein